MMSKIFGNVPGPEALKRMKEIYKPGTRVELISMDDVQAPPPGTLGTVTGVDDLGSVMVNWDTGSSLSLVYMEDSFRVAEDER